MAAPLAQAAQAPRAGLSCVRSAREVGDAGVTEVIELTAEEWRRMQMGPYGTCKGCNEPNAYCQCVRCHVCGGKHDRNYGCPENA